MLFTTVIARLIKKSDSGYSDASKKAIRKKNTSTSGSPVLNGSTLAAAVYTLGFNKNIVIIMISAVRRIN